MEMLRPVEVTQYEKVFKGLFHEWTDNHKKVGEISMGGPAAIIEKKSGEIVVVNLENATIKFTDIKESTEVKVDVTVDPNKQQSESHSTIVDAVENIDMDEGELPRLKETTVVIE